VSLSWVLSLPLALFVAALDYDFNQARAQMPIEIQKIIRLIYAKNSQWRIRCYLISLPFSAPDFVTMLYKDLCGADACGSSL